MIEHWPILVFGSLNIEGAFETHCLMIRGLFVTILGDLVLGFGIELLGFYFALLNPLLIV